MRYLVSACGYLLIAFFAAVNSQAADRNALSQALQARYEEKPGIRGYAAVGSNGPILTVAQQGISAVNPPQGSLTVIPTNKVVNGRIVPLGAFSQSSVQNSGRVLDVGEPVQVLRVEVKNDDVKISFATCSACENGAPAFSAALLFAFPKGSLDSATPSDVEKVIENYLAFPQQAAQANAPPAAPAQPAAAPPPSEPAAPPATISLGQTIDQVVATLGQPLQIIDLGSKKTYKYKDLKVIFTNGKVTDVQ
jgi:hypothetical protein